MSKSESNSDQTAEDVNKPFETIVEIKVDNQSIQGSKQMLIKKSGYFRRLLAKGILDNSIKTDEKYIKYLVTILKIGFEIESIEQLIESNDCLNTVCEITQIANKYEFFGIERQLSDKIIEKWFQRIDTFCELCLLMETYLKFKGRLQYFPENCLKAIDRNADQVMELMDNEVLLTAIKVEFLIDVFSRDTFGVNEMKIYFLIYEWIKSNQIINKYLIQTIRLSKLDPNYEICAEIREENIYLELVNVVKNEMIENEINENNRICCQPNVWFAINDYDFEDIKVSPNVFALKRKTAKAITFSLPIETTINCIKFKTTTDFSKPDIHSPQFLSVYYYCEVCVKNEWIKVVDFSTTSCFSTQELCIEELVVSAIRLIGVTNKDTKHLNRFSLNFLENNLLFYGLIDQRVETKDNSILPKRSYLSKSDAICYINLLDLGTICLTHPLKYSLIFNKRIYNYFQRNCSETIYSIRLTQPVFVNCLELFFFNQSKEKFILSISYCLDSFQNPIPIVPQFELTTDSNTFDFEAKHMLMIQICCESKGKPLRLHDINLYYKN